MCRCAARCAHRYRAAPYAHNHRISANGPPDGGFPAFHTRGLEESAVATWLHDAGYRTALLGKYLQPLPGGGGRGVYSPGWDAWYAPVGENADSRYNDSLNENGVLRTYGRRPEDYLGDVLTSHAERFVRGAVFP